MRTPPDNVIAAAREAQATWKIPASVTLAQWAQESGWGEHMPPGSNNPFGIKAVNGQPFVVAQTHEVINGVTKIVTARFRKFDSLADAFKAHAGLLAVNPEFAAARARLPNATEFAEALWHYATDPHYGDELANLIEEEDFLKYDQA